MKQYKYILSSCLAVLFGACLFTGCATDEMIGGDKGATETPLLSIMAGVSETAVTRADDPLTDLENQNGSWISNMTIFLFEPGADDDSKPLLVKTAKATGAISTEKLINSVELTKKDLTDANIVLGTQVDIYAIANHILSNAAELTKKEIMELKGTLPKYLKTNGTYNLVPMSGTALGYTITSEDNQQTTISLHRTIIHIKITVIDAEFIPDGIGGSEYYWSVMTLKLYNDYSTTYLWNKGIPSSPVCRDEKQALMTDFAQVNDGIWGYPPGDNYALGSYYLNNNEPSDANPQPVNKITVKLTGARFINGIEAPYEYTIELKRPDGTYNFERNTILNVTITLKAKGGHDTNVDVVPWNVDTENSDIDATGVRFVDTDIPTVIPKDGTIAANFNFYNPANIPFKFYMIEGETHTGVKLNELDPLASLQQVAVTQLAANTTTATRKVSFWYQYDGVWVDTGVRAAQHGEEIVGITQPKANSYLVAPGSESILIPVSQVNKANAPGIAADEVLTAEMIWTDVKGATSGKGLAADAAVAAIEVLGTGPDALLMVKPGSQLGNAVIAVKSAGVVKWSWHIWVTDYNPEKETGQNTSGGYIFMDRNLGAKSIVPSTTGVDIIGNYYQFGRKDPFPTKSSTTGFVPVYNADGVAVTQTAGSSSALNQIQNPYLWGNATGYPAGLDLWDANGNKTVNDPCPAGWRVPSVNAYIDLTHAIFPNDASTMGRKGAHTGYYPYTWFKDPNSTFNNMKLVVNWTSTPDGTANGRFLRAEVGTSVVVNYSYTRAIGHAVRCVRDWNKGKFEKEIRVLTAGNYSVSTAHQLGTHSVNTGWSSGIVNILNQNFGKGDPVDVFFKHYNYYNGGYGVDGKDYDIIDLLATHEIDVLYLPWNGDQTSPTADQAKKIVGWLDADPNRVLIVATEFTTQHDMLMAELGFIPHTYSQEGLPSVLAGGNSTIYNAMTDGKYGKLAGTAFANILGNGWITRTEIDRNGYVPILTRQGDANKVTMSVSTTRRVLLIGDTNWFDPGNALGGAGSLSYKGFGEYPLLLANAWAWIAEVVTTK